MKILDLSFPTPEENLACDEALLDGCEEDPSLEILRFWESREHFLVLGYSNKIRSEIKPLSRAKNGLGVFRRSSGGGAVLQGPGCLNYALVLRIPPSGPLRSITQTNCHVLERHRDALKPLLGKAVAVRGTSDLCLNDLKFSGNAQRRKRSSLLFHGTFLYGMDFDRMEKHLARPSLEPAYRRGRSHKEFLTNLPLSPAQIKTALQKAWDAHEPLEDFPKERTRRLVREKFSQDSWNRKF